MATGIPARLTPAEGRKFGLLVGGAFVTLAVLLYLRGRIPGARIAAVLGTGLLLAGAIFPGRLGPVYRLWMGLAHAMSRVTTPLFMGVVYFAVITPIGVAMRLFGHFPLGRRRAEGGYWHRRDAVTQERSMENQF